MNGLHYRLLLLALFAFGTINIGSALNLKLDGGEMMILTTKLGNQEVMLPVPKKFTADSYELNTPVQISIYQEGAKTPLHVGRFSSLNVELPTLKLQEGKTYIVSLTVGGYHHTETLIY